MTAFAPAIAASRFGAWSHLDDRATPIVVPFRAESSPRLLMRTRQHLRWRITEYEEVINGLPESLQELVVVCRPRYATFAGHRSASHAARWVACHGVRSHPVPVRLWAIGRRAEAASRGRGAQSAPSAHASSRDEGKPLAPIGSSVLLPESLHFGKSPTAGATARAHLAVAAHHCVVSQHRRQRSDEHLALLVEAPDMLCGLQLTVLKRFDLAARDGESIFAHVASFVRV
jgi:hypothetical protein